MIIFPNLTYYCMLFRYIALFFQYQKLTYFVILNSVNLVKFDKILNEITGICSIKS